MTNQELSKKVNELEELEIRQVWLKDQLLQCINVGDTESAKRALQLLEDGQIIVNDLKPQIDILTVCLN